MTSFPASQSGQDDSRIEIRPVSGKRELKLFITLPCYLYAGREGFVAPLTLEQNDLLHPKRAAIFRHASIQYFLAWCGDVPVGRIAAIVDFVAIEHWKQKIGYFGALDALPGSGTAALLLQAAQDWLREQGMSRMRGPLTLSCNGESGLMIEGFQEPAMIALPWHPPGLGDEIEAAGLSKAMDLLSYRLDLSDAAETAHAIPGGMKIGEGALSAISVSSLSKRQIAANGEVLRKLYNDGWEKTWNFVPLQSYEMTALISQLKPLLRPEHYVQINQDGAPVAMALVVPNLHDISYDLNGAPSLLGWVKLGQRLLRHKFTSARVILLGVSSALEGTLLGALVPGLAIAELLRRGRHLPYHSVELGWVLETNLGMRRLIERLVPEPNKRHRVYEKDISGSV